MANPPSPTETINVSRDVMRTFRRAVLLRHAKLYGALGNEASEALRLHAQRLLQETAA